MRAKGHETIGLLASPAAQDGLDRCGEVVVAEQGGNAAEEAEGLGVGLEEGLLALVVEGLRVGGA